MSMTEAQKRDAYLEAKHILRMDNRWQELMPGERKPNFKRAAREIIRRALGHKVRRNQAPLNLHSGLMHQHGPREARLVERTLRNGMHAPGLLHSSTACPKAGTRFPNRTYTLRTPSCRTSTFTFTITVSTLTTPAITNRARTRFTAVCTRPPNTKWCPCVPLKARD